MGENAEKLSFVARITRLFQPVDLAKGSVWRAILQLAVPIIISYLLQQLYVLSEAHDNAAQQHNGRCNDRPQQHLHHLLNLVDVVCSSGNQ